MEKQVETLVNRAAEAKTADEAMKFSQAACNAANALRAIADAKAVSR